ncbi:MAG: thiamine diphosphokinase [Ruminococcaceae bacterium]|nr:thiamine diphosphokinase [Oscillospiraceae bacterium]
MRAVIITGGMIDDYNYYKNYFNEDDIVICADGGVKHLINLDLDASYFLGDFDSCNFEDVKNDSHLKNAQIIKFNSEKDETDTEIALNLALEKGVSNIVILGAIGTRIDHTLANIMLMKKALKHNVELKIVNEKNEIRLVDKSISLNPVKNAFLSVIALKTTTNLTLKNVKYELNEFTLSTDTSLGISNEFTDKKAIISFDEGLLLVIISRD